MVSTDFKPLFLRLRTIRLEHANGFSIAADTPTCFGLEADAGPAAVRAWGGKMKLAKIPAAWVEIGKAYVSYHLMSMYGNPKLLKGMSKKLKARMQGKTCFNFTVNDEALFKELEKHTVEGLTSFKESGFAS